MEILKLICQDCHGAGKMRHPLRRALPVAEEWQAPWLPPVITEVTAVWLLCRACGGSGITSCCDGAVGCASDMPGHGVN